MKFEDWLIKNYPDKSKWCVIDDIKCENKNLTTLEGIEHLTNLESLWCANNNLTSLKGIENLKKLNSISCHSNPIITYCEILKLNNLEWLNSDITNKYPYDTIRIKNKIKKLCLYVNRKKIINKLIK